MPPTLILHGDADRLVPLQQSQRLIEKLKAEKIPCELKIIPGKGHGWIGMEKDGEALAQWFLKYLKK
jgi:dipeptidyl aminopeptidase/acylaminoacyl peptidase